MAARHKEGFSLRRISPCIFNVCGGTSNDAVGEGGKGHRILGDTADSWFQKQAISWKKSWEGYRRTTHRLMWLLKIDATIAQ